MRTLRQRGGDWSKVRPMEELGFEPRPLCFHSVLCVSWVGQGSLCTPVTPSQGWGSWAWGEGERMPRKVGLLSCKMGTRYRPQVCVGRWSSSGYRYLLGRGAEADAQEVLHQGQRPSFRPSLVGPGPGSAGLGKGAPVGRHRRLSPSPSTALSAGLGHSPSKVRERLGPQEPGPLVLRCLRGPAPEAVGGPSPPGMVWGALGDRSWGRQGPGVGLGCLPTEAHSPFLALTQSSLPGSSTPRWLPRPTQQDADSETQGMRLGLG